MGNVVAGEALKLAGSSQVVNTYIAMQGAIAAHCYDQIADFRDCYVWYLITAHRIVTQIIRLTTGRAISTA